jgi:uncharacterized membrane protein
MGFLIGTSVLGALGALGLLAAAAALALPVAWLWMLIDALLREEWEYPDATARSNNRLLWVLLILFVHVTAVVYFFVVYRNAPRRGRTPSTATA